MNIISPTLMKILTSRSVIAGSDHKEGRCYCNYCSISNCSGTCLEEATEAGIKVVSFDNVVDTDEQVATVGILMKQNLDALVLSGWLKNWMARARSLY